MSQTKNEILKLLSQYISMLCDLHENEIDFNLDLIEERLVDSIKANDVLAYIEETFNLALEEEHIFDRRFVSINGMAEVIMEILSNKS